MHAQTVDAANWWARSRGATTANWIANYQNSLKTRHRGVISQIVGTIGATSLLEFGSHCGPNLVRLATDHPSLEQLTGFDVNADAIASGVSWMKRLGLDERVTLVTGQIPGATGSLEDRCVDVVLSCYALAYTAPSDLDGVLWEMGRLARKAVILAEPMTDASIATSATNLSGYQEWAHNYHAASRWMSTWHGMAIRTALVTPPVDHLERILVAVRDGSENTQ